MKLLFALYIMLGLIKPQEIHDDRKTYMLKTKEGVYEHCYKEEIQEYFRTGVFKYNEDLD